MVSKIDAGPASAGVRRPPGHRCKAIEVRQSGERRALVSSPDPLAPWVIFTRALLVSLTDPKTLLFLGAFFPRFVGAGAVLAVARHK